MNTSFDRSAIYSIPPGWLARLGVNLNLLRILIVIVSVGFAPVAGAKDAGQAPGRPWFFVQMTDTHWGAKDGMAMTRSAVSMINRLPVKVEFVAVTGDLFADSILKEAVVREGVEVLKALKAPVYCIPGNHDLLKGDYTRTRAVFEKNFGPVQQKLVTKGVVCLFLCTELPDEEKRSFWQVTRTDIAKMLVDTTDPVLIFMHRPPVVDLLGGDGDMQEWGAASDSRWERLFENYPSIKGVFAGHFHRDEMIWIGTVPVYVAPALARFWDRQPAFRLYEYKDGRINYWTLYPERPPRK